jgi:hypothetical protein
VAHYRTGRGRLPAQECHHLATNGEVRGFLEQRCHLIKSIKIPGQEFTEHRDAFRVWHRWLDEGTLSAPFSVVHVDAHADLGCGSSWEYLQTKLLALPLERRTRPRFGRNGVNSGNYLLFAIANRWIQRLTYVYPIDPGVCPPQPTCSVLRPIEEIVEELGDVLEGSDLPPVSDLPPECFRNQDWKTMLVELNHYSPRQYKDIALLKKRPLPVHREPAVPMRCVAADGFELNGFTHMVVARSPQYTTKSADSLLPVFREYFEPA